MGPRIGARGAVIVATGLAVAAACFDVPLAGKPCSDEHACVPGFVCRLELCVVDDGAGEGEGEGEGDAGEGEGDPGEGEGDPGEGEGDAGEGEGEGEGEGDVLAPFFHWTPSEPDAAGDEDCLRLRRPEGTWGDERCTTTAAFVCDVPAGTGAVAGCATELVAGKTRLFCDGPATATSAASTCAASSGTLTILESRAEELAVLGRAGVHIAGGNTDLWLGGSDGAVEGVWRWPDGRVIPTPYSDWDADDPSNSGGTQHCLEMQLIDDGLTPPGRWNDVTCTVSKSYVCELPLGSSTGTCSGVPAAGVLRAYCRASVTFDDARSACTSLGGSLARIDDSDEDAQIESEARAALSGEEDIWLGGSDVAVEGEWRWPDGALFELL